MQEQVTGLYFNPWPEKWWHSKEPLRNPIELYRRGLWYKSNPRDEAYMKALFDEKYPGGRFVNVKENPGWPGQVKEGSTILLLYPDSIGLGFSVLEREVRGRTQGAPPPRVLNGRRRDFVLDGPTRVALKIRRFMERTMLMEIGFTLIFVAVTPILLTMDWIRGRT
jgi:hypothetical protein